MVDGIIYASHSMDSDFLGDIHVPTVMVDNMFPGLPTIMSDNVQGGYLAARHLIARGCRNMIAISGQEDLHLEADQRTEYFAKECERQGVSYKLYSADEEMLREMEYSSLISRIFNENPDMDGIFASSDIIAAQCIQAAAVFGYRIPENLKIVGYDDICLSRLIYPPLTTVRQNIKDLVKTAMATMIALIEGKEVPATQIIPVTFVERRTT